MHNQLSWRFTRAITVLARISCQWSSETAGPVYKSMRVEGTRIRIAFDHLGSGLAARDGRPTELTWFEIAGPDRTFVKAAAQIDGNSVLASSAHVTQPVAVRFGWHETAAPNLINKEGLPAMPFLTNP